MALGLLTALTTAALFMGSVQLDEEFKQNISVNDCAVELISKVSKSGDTYTYMYSIKNTGKVPVKVKWTALNRALQSGSESDILLDIKPGENLNFVLEHPDPPMQTWSQAAAFTKSDRDRVLDEIKRTPNVPKGVKITMPKLVLYSCEGTWGVNSVLPKSYIQPFGFAR